MTGTEFQNYPSLAQIAPADTLLALHKADTSASSLGTVHQASASSFSITVTPSADETGATDTAAINTVAQSGQIASLVPGGTYYVTNLLPDSYGGIYGNNATLNVTAGTTGYAIALKTPATTKYIVLQDLIVQCNDVCGGVQLDNTGFQPDIQYNPYDPLHVLRNVFVLAANGDGFHLDNNARGLFLSQCHQYFASGYGFFLGPGADSDSDGATDCNLVGCTSGPSGDHGFYLADAASDNMLVACKAFYSGFVESTGEWGTTACGFEVLGSWNTITACNAQQAALHGIDLNGCSNVTVTGCDADTNSAGASVTTGVGINVNGTSWCSVVGNTGSVNTYDPPGSQAYGIQLTGTLNNTSVIGNSVTGLTSSLNSTYTDGGGNSVIDPAAVFLNYPYFRTEMGLLGLTAVPGTEQYFALLYGWDGSGGDGYAQPATVTGAGLSSMLQMSQYSATSAVTVADSDTIASLGSLSVPANDPVAGARYRVTAHGQLSTTGTPTYICDLRWGGTTGTFLVSVQSATTGGGGAQSAPAFAAALTTAPILIEGEIEFRTSTTVVGWLRMSWRPSATTATTVVLNSITTAVTVSISAAESLSLDWTWGTISASNTITIASSSFERVA